MFAKSCVLGTSTTGVADLAIVSPAPLERLSIRSLSAPRAFDFIERATSVEVCFAEPLRVRVTDSWA